MSIKYSLLMIFAVLIQGCASNPIAKLIPQTGKQDVAVKTVKTVAVVAFETREVTLGGLKSKVFGSSAQQLENTQAIETQLSTNIYNDLTMELKGVGFKVLYLDQVRGNKYYQSINQKNISVDVLSLNSNQRSTIIQGISRASLDGLQFSEEERARLLKELNVDALVYAKVSFSIPKDTNLLGLGESYLQPNFTFYMYSAHSQDPIWFALNQVGPKSKESMGRVRGFEDQDVIERESRTLAHQTMSSILSK